VLRPEDGSEYSLSNPRIRCDETGRKRGTPNRITIRTRGTFAEAAQDFSAEALIALPFRRE
jgi:hypothetical protein